MTTEIQTVLFDVDDTLFDRNRAQKEILHLIVTELPSLFRGVHTQSILDAFLESDRITFREYEPGMASERFRVRRSETFLGLLGLCEDYAEKITQMYVELYPKVDASVPGAKSLLENLAVRLRVGVISNGLPDVQYLKLETLNIKHLLDCVVLSGDFGIEKPDPRIFHYAAELLCARPGECLYVGDSYNDDVAGSKSAGMLACWFNPRGSAVSRTDIKPDLEVRALDTILGFVS